MTYTLGRYGNTVIRDADQAHIPFDPGNIDYQKYLTWLDAGNTPTAYTLPGPSVAQLAPAPLRLEPTVDSPVFSPPPELVPVIVTPASSPPPSTLAPPAPTPQPSPLSGI